MPTIQDSDFPLMRRVDKIVAENWGGFQRQVLFSPSTAGSKYMKFVVVHGQPGTKSPSYVLAGDEMTLTLKGCAQSITQGQQRSFSKGTAIVLPASVEHMLEVAGDEEWIGVSASCDECPLMREQLTTGLPMPPAAGLELPVIPITRCLDQIAPENLYGFERRVLFSPSTVGTRTLRFAVVHGKPGAKSKPHTHPGGELALTLAGNAQLISNGKRYDLSAGSAIAVPPSLTHPATAVGDEKWVVVTSYCDECPLMLEKQRNESDSI